ncbi:cupin domain-containing protein [Nocardioides anomalus]|uniref:Cupin domain-containing protein n=1 Tax=Nocardioides anomalus TaxID=2712223 RepID=A0A6G6WG92_9ACTN|nr:cupin domain-containing protein [Nocardioides anomalus]QIG44177.1 cupin domain-containing protein [Nocardioides anomalus]
MSTHEGEQLVVHEPGTGRATWAMGSLFEHLLERGQSDRLGVALVTQPPGIATPLHRHSQEAEAFFVLEGRLSYQAGEELHELYDGCFIHLPQGVPHAFRIRGDSPAKLLALTAPAGLLHLYDEVGLPAAERRLPGEDGQTPEVEIPKWVEVGPRYGLEVVGPPIPE